MPQDQKTANADTPTANSTSTQSSNSEYLQPLAVAFASAIFGFSFSYYYHADLIRALAVGGFTSLVLFWVVLRGNKRKKQLEVKGPAPAAVVAGTPELPQQASVWPAVAILVPILFGFAVAIYYTASEALDRRAKANRLLQAEKDDKVVRVRKMHCIFWDEVSKHRPSRDDEIDAVAAELKIPIHSIEKNWPRGPLVITYEGTAKDAYMIHDAMRWKVGLPTATYQFVK